MKIFIFEAQNAFKEDGSGTGIGTCNFKENGSWTGIGAYNQPCLMFMKTLGQYYTLQVCDIAANKVYTGLVIQACSYHHLVCVSFWIHPVRQCGVWLHRNWWWLWFVKVCWDRCWDPDSCHRPANRYHLRCHRCYYLRVPAQKVITECSGHPDCYRTGTSATRISPTARIRTRYSSPSISHPSILRPPLIIRPLDLVPKGNFLLDDL